MEDNPFRSPHTPPVKKAGWRKIVILISRVMSVALIVILLAVAIAGYVVIRMIGH